jgi:simple sugar transport system permease protein
MTPGLTALSWVPLLHFPIEWGALSLLACACLYWERSGFSGIGIEGCVAAGTLGLILGFEWTGQYPLAVAIAVGFAMAFALAMGALLQLMRADMAVGSFALSLVPLCGLALLTRAGPFAIFATKPAPGLVSGTAFTGTYAEDLIANPLLLAAPFLVVLAAWILWHTPFGLRIRAFGENPELRIPRLSPALHRFGGLAVGSILVVPATALLLRTHPGNPPAGLGLLALGCVMAGRWSIAAAILLAAGPALLRSARPYAETLGGYGIVAEMAPFLLVLLYLMLLARRSLRLAPTSQSRLDPDTL